MEPSINRLHKPLNNRLSDPEDHSLSSITVEDWDQFDDFDISVQSKGVGTCAGAQTYNTKNDLAIIESSAAPDKATESPAVDRGDAQSAQSPISTAKHLISAPSLLSERKEKSISTGTKPTGASGQCLSLCSLWDGLHYVCLFRRYSWSQSQALLLFHMYTV